MNKVWVMLDTEDFAICSAIMVQPISFCEHNDSYTKKFCAIITALFYEYAQFG